MTLRAARTPKKHLSFLLIFAALFLLASPAYASQAEGSIQFSGSSLESDYPSSLTFSITAESSQGDITSARLHYALGEDASVTLQNVEFDPASRVELSYEWDTSDITIPPSTPIIYHWEVMDSAGNRVSSLEEFFHYDDVRFDWQVLQDDYLAVWTHDRDPSFGQRVFDIARQSFAQQRAMFGQDPEKQIKVIIYNDFAEFEEWHSFIGEWVGGQAFPNIGVTTQIVSAYSSIESWLNNVIPHEIAHLYFFQATDHAYVTPPAWLNEGLAQLTEITPNDAALESVHREISQGNLLPLWSLTGSFGNDDYQVAMAYAEALSVATFILERYGNTGITSLLEAYRNGLADDEALKQGLGVTLVELQEEWLEWMGVDPAMYPAPTAEPTIAWPTPPTYPTSKPRSSPTPEFATSTPESLTSSPTAAPPTLSPTGIVQVENTSQPDASPDREEILSRDDIDEEDKTLALCGAAALPLLGFLFFYIANRRLG